MMKQERPIAKETDPEWYKRLCANWYPYNGPPKCGCGVGDTCAQCRPKDREEKS